MKRNGMSLRKRHLLIGWGFILPAAMLILVFSFYPMFQALLLSLKKGNPPNLVWNGISNYFRILKDKQFSETIFNTVFYLVIQVPIMLFFALILASILNNKNLKFKGLFRTLIFLPCATSLVSYSMIFRSMFANDGFVNHILVTFGFEKVGWFQNDWLARGVIIIALIWRWTGYNMVFFLAGLQNIQYSVYEAAKIDGATPFQSFRKITIPLLRPTILLTAIMSINGTLQLFDESINITNGGPGIATKTMSHYIYDTSFKLNPNFPYAATMSVIILVMVTVLSIIQLKVGDKRD